MVIHVFFHAMQLNCISRMELESGHEHARATYDFTSCFQVSKDQEHPLFSSHETDVAFILTGHLKGYTEGNIRIDINKNGTLITVWAKREVKHMLMVGWRVCKKETEKREFKKLFRIPDTVILDEIIARFDEDGPTLVITMPKNVKGIQGTVIEEIQDLGKQNDGDLQISNRGDERSDQEKGGVSESGLDASDVTQEGFNIDEQKSGKVVANEKTVLDDGFKPKDNQKVDGAESFGADQKVDESQNENNLVKQSRSEIDEQKEDEEVDKEPESSQVEVDDQEQKGRCGRSKSMCSPMAAAAGSALFLSFVVFVFKITRNKNQTKKMKDN